MSQTLEKIQNLIEKLHALSKSDFDMIFEADLFINNHRVNISAGTKDLSVNDLDKKLKDKLSLISDKLNVKYSVDSGFWIFKPKYLNVSPLAYDSDSQAIFVYQMLRYLYDLPDEFDVRFGEVSME